VLMIGAFTYVFIYMDIYKCISVYVYVLTYVREVPGALQGRPRVLEPTLSARFHADANLYNMSMHCIHASFVHIHAYFS
jgi:hypothetical protein